MNVNWNLQLEATVMEAQAVNKVQLTQHTFCNRSKYKRIYMHRPIIFIECSVSYQHDQGRSQKGGGWVHAPVTVGLFLSRPRWCSLVSIFCLWTPLGTSVPKPPGLSPLSKFLATPLNTISTKQIRRSHTSLVSSIIHLRLLCRAGKNLV